jgi:hypothetical protein
MQHTDECAYVERGEECDCGLRVGGSVAAYRVWVWKDNLDVPQVAFVKPQSHIEAIEYVMAPNELDPSGLSLAQLVAGKNALYSCSEDPGFDDVRKVFAALFAIGAVGKPRPFLGITVVINPNLPHDVVEFRDSTGAVVGRITGLAVDGGSEHG